MFDEVVRQQLTVDWGGFNIGIAGRARRVGNCSSGFSRNEIESCRCESDSVDGLKGEKIEFGRKPKKRGRERGVWRQVAEGKLGKCESHHPPTHQHRGLTEGRVHSTREKQKQRRKLGGQTWKTWSRAGEVKPSEEPPNGG